MATPELRVPMSATDATDLMGRIPADAFGDATVTTLDGLRADWPDGWGLVRTSNTTPDLILRFEGDDEEALRRVQARFREILLSVEPGLALPF
jgi:phosphomannomutase/phosphoglucomutase